MKETIRVLEEHREQIREEAERQMDALTRAIDVLQSVGQRPEAGSPRSEQDRTPSVREMVEQAGEALAEGKDEDYFFTFKQVKDWIAAKWPEEKKKIRTGFYPAVNLVVQAGVWDRADNGFKIAKEPKG